MGTISPSLEILKCYHTMEDLNLLQATPSVSVPSVFFALWMPTLLIVFPFLFSD